MNCQMTAGKKEDIKKKEHILLNKYQLKDKSKINK